VRSLERRLENLERLVERRVEDLKIALCPKPCKGPITMSQRRLMPDGSVEVSGEPPPPLCDACPERDNPKAPIRHIEVRHGFPSEAGRDIWEVVDTESETSEARAVIKVVYDDQITTAGHGSLHLLSPNFGPAHQGRTV
jgi:hypothetical protein